NFNNVYLGYLGDWLSNRLNQSVATNASVRFSSMQATELGIGGARDGGINNGVIRVIPNSSGQFGINIRQTDGQTANLLNFFDTGNNTIARVTAAGNVAGTGAYTNLSDRRTKHAITDATDIGLTTIQALRPRYYVRNGHTERELGFIAQEVETALPEATTYMDPAHPKTSFKAIQSEAIVTTLVKAVQQLKTMFDDRDSEIATLKAHNAALTKRLEALEQRIAASGTN
ncbi:MAG: tail fiber domain-containing protein, partial [Alphaproteobacteria bacterium]